VLPRSNFRKKLRYIAFLNLGRSAVGGGGSLFVLCVSEYRVLSI